MPSCFWIVAGVVRCEAIDNRVKHLLLQGPRYLGALDQFVSGFRKAAGLRKEALESQYLRARRTEYRAGARRHDRPSGQRLATSGELFGP